MTVVVVAAVHVVSHTMCIGRAMALDVGSAVGGTAGALDGILLIRVSESHK